MSFRDSNKMTNTGERDPLDAIIEEYAAASPGPSREMLARWTERYPQHAAALADFTASWTAASPLAPPAAVEDDDTMRVAARHALLARAILERYAAAAEEPQPLRGIVAEAQAAGLSRKQVAVALDLSIALVDKLDRRLVRYTTVPGAIVEGIARLLSTTGQRVASYLQGPPLLPVAASYRAEQAPAAPEPQSFAQAVEADRTLSPERKRQLLSMAQEGE